MRRLGKLVEIGPRSPAWPIVLFSVALSVSTIALLWFMNSAVQNERLALRQKLVESSDHDLRLARDRADAFWLKQVTALQELGRNRPSEAFAGALQKPWIKATLILNSDGTVLYPDKPQSRPAPYLISARWQEAARIEYELRQPQKAAELYAHFANQDDPSTAAAARQAQVRCWLSAGDPDQAFRMIQQHFEGPANELAIDHQGRFIQPSMHLLGIELARTKDPAKASELAENLRQKLLSYSPALPSAQRRFLMSQLQEWFPGMEFSTLAGERRSALLAEQTSPGTAGVTRDSISGGEWLFRTPDGRVLIEFSRESFAANLERELGAASRIKVFAPAEGGKAFATVALGAGFPGWRLGFQEEPASLGELTKQRRILHMWTGFVLLITIGLTGWFALRQLQRQTTLARLKNDLAATVSHELKTPLASMQVLLDTWQAHPHPPVEMTSDYMRLISAENQRLTGLIDKFLTFSRMERGKYQFHPARLAVGELQNSVVETFIRQHDLKAGELEVVPFPERIIWGDRVALQTALLNLLENAYKYGGEPRRIGLRCGAWNGSVDFEVSDNGAGLTRSDQDRIFEEFYQGDMNLTRERGGCGLGLSIVKGIAELHQGRVSVKSEPGRGSVFTLTFPVSANQEPG